MALAPIRGPERPGANCSAAIVAWRSSMSRQWFRAEARRSAVRTARARWLHQLPSLGALPRTGARVMEGDRRFDPSQDAPTSRTRGTAEPLGLRTIRINRPDQVAAAWDAAFAASGV